MPRRRDALTLALVAAVAAPAAAAAPSPTEPAVQAAFSQESYAPGSVASLRFFSAARGVAVQIFQSGPERMHTRRADVMNGVAVTEGRWLGAESPGASAAVAVGGAWPSGLYFAKLTAQDSLVGYAPFVVRPPRLGESRVAVVLPTQTWQAYNFRDDNGDGTPDTWYAGGSDTVRLYRPFLDRGVPYRFRHYDLPLLHWLAWTGKQVDFLSDSDLERVSNASQLAAAYDLIVFSGHHEYVTTHEYDLIHGYRDLGGNLMFLFANDFFWQVDRQGNTITRTKRWRTLGRPEASLIGVEYRGNDNGRHKGPWRLRATNAAPWLTEGTGLIVGSRFGSGGIEIDARAPSSPPQLVVLAEIPNLYGPGFTAQMSYYETPAGAKVFAAGAFDLVESILEPDKPLPDAAAERNEAAARLMLENLWAQMSTP